MDEQRYKYPRTPILPWSPGKDADDIRLIDPESLFAGREVVVTEKMDGENTSIYRDGVHARSMDSGHHPSRAWVKALQGRVGWRLPPGLRLCGENLYAKHSIGYTALRSFFYLFSVWQGSHCLSWDETLNWAAVLGLTTPRQLYRGRWDEGVVCALGEDLDTEHQEGYVVRTCAGFEYGEFRRSVAKWVRARHVQTSVHWMHAELVPNKLKRGG